MTKPTILKAILVFALFGATYVINAQGSSTTNAETKNAPAAKPYKVLTNGKQITIQAKQNLKSLMVWSANGHRIVEEKELKTSSYSFYVPTKEKICFISIETMEGKRFSEKIGVK